jgi:hypothetical protein
MSVRTSVRDVTGPGDVDPCDLVGLTELVDVTARAVDCTAPEGYADVAVVCADAEHPVAPARRFDLIIVTAGAREVPPAWRDQLTGDGAPVVPLRAFGMTRSWALRRRGDRLVNESRHQCGFVSKLGDGDQQVCGMSTSPTVSTCGWTRATRSIAHRRGCSRFPRTPLTATCRPGRSWTSGAAASS